MMPLSNVHIERPDSRHIVIEDGNKFLLKLFVADYDSREEAERIASLIEDLLSNHGANDDTTGLYDEDES